MRTRLLASCLLLAIGCRRHRHGGHHDRRASTTGHWRVAPAPGPGLEVAFGCYLIGALRITSDAAAQPPWPATPLVAATHTGDAWRFAAADGTMYEARGFLGALTVATARSGGASEARPWVPTEARATAAAIRARWQVLPPNPWDVAARPDGTLAVVRHADGVLRTVDPSTGWQPGQSPLPGRACALAGSTAGLRAVCEREDGTTAVLAEEPHGGWRTLRVDPPGSPGGAVAFDDTSARWVLAAPCAPGADIDPRALCTYDTDGQPHEVHLPLDALPVTMHDGTVLVAEAAPWGDHTRGALVRDGVVTPVDLPVGAEAVRAGRWAGAALTFWDSSHGGALELVRGTRGPTGQWTWQRVPAPAGTSAGAHAPWGAEYAVGLDAGAVWESTDGQSFHRLPSPVRGDPAALQLPDPADSYCVGTMCRFGGALEWSRAPGPSATVVAR